MIKTIRTASLTFIIILLAALISPAFAEVIAINFNGGSAAVNETGEILIDTGNYDRIYVLRNDSGAHTGYAAGRIIDGVMRYAVLNTEATELTDFIYSGVWEAGDGCIVCENGVYKYLSGYGVYDSYTFSGLKYLGSGRLLATTGNRFDDIGDTLTILWPDGLSFNTGISTMNTFGDISEGLMPLYDYRTHSYGYINTQGSWAIKPAYRYAGSFKNGLAIIGTENGYGVIDTTGKIKLAASSLQLARTNSIFAAIRSDTLRLYDSELTQRCIMPLYGASVNLTGEYVVLSGSDSEAVYDVDGMLLFSAPAGSQIFEASGETLIVRTGSWGENCVTLRAKNGTILSNEYASIYSLDSAMLAYGIWNDNAGMLYGLMAYDGTVITEAVYLTMSCAAEGIYCADTENGAVLLDSEGNVLNAFPVSENTVQN